MSSNTQSSKKKANNGFVNTDSKKKYSKKKKKTPVQISLENLRKSKEFRDLGDAFDYFD